MSFSTSCSQVEDLDLSNNNFLAIPQPLLVQYTELVSLNLSSNHIPFIARNTFGRMGKLKTLDLSDNLIKSLSDIEAGILFTGNTKLQTLNLSGNGVADLGDGYDQILYSESLLQLDVSRCSITHLQGPVVLQGLPRLLRLDLSKNALTRIDGLASASLQLLDLSECNLQFLRRDSFDRLPNLKEVRLSGNCHLTDQYLRPASTSVIHVDVSHCAIRTNYASELTQSETVLLKGNLLDELPAGAFQNNSKLETLDLSDNRIRHVHLLAFAGANSLRWVDLSGNRVTELATNTFSQCPRLRHLYANANWFAAVPLLNSSSLLVFDVSESRVRDMTESTLTLLPALHTLNISHNHLDHLPAWQLGSLSLQVLDVSYCRLTSVDESSLGHLMRLREIDLRGNRLVRLRSNAFANSQLEYISLAENPWICDCQDHSFHQLWLYLVTEPSKLKHGGSPRCQHPENVTDQPWSDACHSQWSIEPRKSKDLIVLIVIVTVLLVSGIVACVVAAKESWRVRRSRRAADCAPESQRLNCDEDSTGTADRNAICESTRKLAQLPSYDEALLLAKPTPSSGSASASSGDTAATPASKLRQSVIRLEMSKKRQSATQTEETIDALLREMAGQEAEQAPGCSPTHSFHEERREYQNVKLLPVQCTEL